MPQPPAKQFSGIFVSYRRDDSSGHAGRLSDRLVEHFGKERIFMDIDTIEPGEDFVTVIENAVGSCEILIAIIGRNWLTGTGGTTGRLDNPTDFVRLEIATALSRDIRVIPVLVQRASMPKPQDLPEDLAKFARRNAVELSDLRWQSDVDQLIAVMERVLAKREAAVLAGAESQSEAERQRREDEQKRLATEQVRVAEEEANERVAAQRPREEKELERREAEERARHEAREAARLRAEDEIVHAKAGEPKRADEERLATEARFRESDLAAKAKQLESATEITAEVPMPADKDRHVVLIALASLIVLVAAVALIWLMQSSRNRAPAQLSPAIVSRTPGAVVLNQIGMELVYVPAGSFMMGASNLSNFVSINEKPVHRVTFREGFHMGKYEVTQAQWTRIMGTNPSHFTGNNLPVEQVSWYDAQDFIRKLNEMNDGYTYRLPSEAEWEYTCRAGTTGDFAGDMDAMTWYSDNSGSKTHPVGSKQSNAFGLYDMHGNVTEWCQDLFRDNYEGSPVDGSAWENAPVAGSRVVRGGSWSFSVLPAHSAYRNERPPDSRENTIGFRLVAVARS